MFLSSFFSGKITIIMLLQRTTSSTITLFTISDLHFSKRVVPKKARGVIQAMNQHLVGLSLPADIRGQVETPAAVLIAGDLCDGGIGIPAPDTPRWYTRRNYQDQWAGFDYHFPRDGVQGDMSRLCYPCFATTGNHDYYSNMGQAYSTPSYYVAEQLMARHGLDCNIMHGNVHYSVDLGAVHIIALGRSADAHVLEWLRHDLDGVGPRTPIVIFLHYPFTDAEFWQSESERRALAGVIIAHHVVAIVHGHAHYRSGHYHWNGLDVFNNGAAGKTGELGVLQISEDRLVFAGYKIRCNRHGHFRDGDWTWSYVKSLRAAETVGRHVA
jgi:hypothetical protein